MYDHPLQVLREALPASSLSARDAATLTWLTVLSDTRTGLCWVGHRRLQSYLRFSINSIPAALKQLADDGRISIFARPKRTAIYLVHPGGLAQLRPCTEAEIRAYLGSNKFAQRDMDAIAAWVSGVHREAALSHTGVTHAVTHLSHPCVTDGIPSLSQTPVTRLSHPSVTGLSHPGVTNLPYIDQVKTKGGPDPRRRHSQTDEPTGRSDDSNVAAADIRSLIDQLPQVHGSRRDATT